MLHYLYDARWQGVLQFHGAENCLLIECLYPLEALKLITKEQLGMQSDVCEPSLRAEIMPDASVKKSVVQFLEQRETPELSGSYLDAGVALAFHTVVSRSEH